ncbi:hypothetical protein KY285_030694 [Solanum tuberosum]|nr:hypothetical protein KY284_030516 [Solanum tuberosum]KAH0655812.1 hypothetical protein KY285_030694 [Solanum tuberosum]
MVSGQSDDSRGRVSGYLKRYGGNAHNLTRQENCGKGTIRSVHNRFRPIRDGGVALSNHSNDSRQRGSGYLKCLEKRDGGRVYELFRQQKILRRIVSEPIPVMAQIVQQLGDETVESTKEYLSNLITMSERKYEFFSLQNRLDERSNLTNQTLELP